MGLEGVSVWPEGRGMQLACCLFNTAGVPTPSSKTTGLVRSASAQSACHIVGERAPLNGAHDSSPRAHLGSGQVLGEAQQAWPPLAAGQFPIHLQPGGAGRAGRLEQGSTEVQRQAA